MTDAAAVRLNPRVALNEFDEAPVVGLDLLVREVVKRAAPVALARWRFYAMKHYIFIRWGDKDD